MLNINNKSSIILKRLFLYIAEIEKIKIIKYNKSLLNKLNINLIDYKALSGRYLVYEENKKVKYIIIIRMMTECIKYILWRRLFKWKEKWKRKRIFVGNWLVFEGEFLNGKRWKGKEYDINNQLENKIKDGKGFIEEYFITGQLWFEGDI